MSHIEGNDFSRAEVQSNQSPERGIQSQHYDQKQELKELSLDDHFARLPDDIKELILSDQISVDDLKQAIAHLLLSPSIIAHYSSADIETLQMLMGYQSNKNLNINTEQNLSAKSNPNPHFIDETAVPKNGNQGQQTQVQSGIYSLNQNTDVEDLALLKNMGGSPELAQSLQNKSVAPLNTPEQVRTFIDNYRNEIKATQQLTELGTKAQINGNSVSLQGQQGVLTTDNIISFAARGEQVFIENARTIASTEGYQELADQQHQRDGQRENPHDDQRQDPENDHTSIFVEGE